MLRITKKKVFKYQDIWFPDESVYPIKGGCDVCCLIGVPELHEGNIKSIMFNTLISNLEESEEEIFNKIGRSTAKEIRRSENDNFEIKQYSSQDIVNDKKIIYEFAKMYKQNYKLKGLQEYDPSKAIIQNARQNGVVITAALFEGEPLAWHVYMVDESNARSWISTSCFRESDDNDFKRRVGRANKRLRYEDLIYFKRNGKKKYDWGGISSFENPNGIDQLKMSFGGEGKSYFNETFICSKRYKMFYNIKRGINKWKVK